MWSLRRPALYESEEAGMLTWTNFDSFAIKHVISVDCFKYLIFQ